jgi:hypothetical protein
VGHDGRPRQHRLGTAFDNIVWGTDCGGADCDNIVWGTADDDNIVWGTATGDDNIVWGTDDGDNIVWGTGSVDDVVWTTADDNIVWGTSGGIVTIDGSPIGSAAAAGVFDTMTDEQVFDAALAPPAAVALPPDGIPFSDSPPIFVVPGMPPSGDAVIALDAGAPTISNPDGAVVLPLDTTTVIETDPAILIDPVAVLPGGGL